MPVVKAARHIVEDSAKSTASLSASADQIDHQDSVSEAARRKLDSFKYDSSRGLQGNTSISVIAPETSMDVVRAAQGFGTVVYNGTLTEMAGASSSLFSEPLLSSSTGEPRHDDKLLSERAATRLNPSEPPKKKVRKSPELAIDLCNPMAHDNDVPLSEFVWTEIMDELEVFDELVLPGYQSSPPVASFLPATGTVSATSVQQLPTPFPSDAALEKVHGVLQQVDVEDKAPLFPPQDAWMLLDDEDLEMVSVVTAVEHDRRMASSPTEDPEIRRIRREKSKNMRTVEPDEITYPFLAHQGGSTQSLTGSPRPSPRGLTDSLSDVVAC